jgi:uncharacterized membrane-anchored protein YhcB (DUF1043 family)
MIDQQKFPTDIVFIGSGVNLTAHIEQQKWILFILGFVVGFFIGVIVWRLILIYSIKKKIKSYELETNKNSVLEIIEELLKNLKEIENKYKVQVKALKDKISELESKQKQPSEKNEQVPETRPEPEQTEKHHSQAEQKTHQKTESKHVNKPEQTVPSKPKIKTYYFTIPDEDGTFKMQNSRETRDHDCYYKIEHRENEKRGKLHYIGKEDDRIALEKYQYYLLRACVSVSPTPFGKATRIKQIKPGKVELVDGNWKITKKIEIELS